MPGVYKGSQRSCNPPSLALQAFELAAFQRSASVLMPQFSWARNKKQMHWSR